MRYYPYYGRGYVQLTLQGNYRTYSGLLGCDMINDPDLALQPSAALFILVHGMMNASFGPGLPRFVNARKTDFVNARQSVNNLDQADSIARLAEAWLRRLNAAPP
jgi:hypothetical protein